MFTTPGDARAAVDAVNIAAVKLKYAAALVDAPKAAP